MKPDLILCLGNEILSDDGFGPVVAKRLSKIARVTGSADVLFAPLAGFALLDLLTDRKRVLVVDTICSDSLKPGELRLFPAGILTPANHLINSHQMSLPTALELGRKLGYAMPLQVDVLAVGAVNVETLSEELTPSVAGAVERALSMIQEWLAGKGEEYADAEDREASVC